MAKSHASLPGRSDRTQCHRRPSARRFTGHDGRPRATRALHQGCAVGHRQETAARSHGARRGRRDLAGRQWAHLGGPRQQHLRRTCELGSPGPCALLDPSRQHCPRSLPASELQAYTDSRQPQGIMPMSAGSSERADGAWTLETAGKELVLAGVCRGHVIAACHELGVQVLERPPDPNERHSWHEAFLCSSTRLLQPISHISAGACPPARLLPTQALHGLERSNLFLQRTN